MRFAAKHDDDECAAKTLGFGLAYILLLYLMESQGMR